MADFERLFKAFAAVSERFFFTNVFLSSCFCWTMMLTREIARLLGPSIRFAHHRSMVSKVFTVVLGVRADRLLLSRAFVDVANFYYCTIIKNFQVSLCPQKHFSISFFCILWRNCVECFDFWDTCQRHPALWPILVLCPLYPNPNYIFLVYGSKFNANLC